MLAKALCAGLLLAIAVATVSQVDGVPEILEENADEFTLGEDASAAYDANSYLYVDAQTCANNAHADDKSSPGDQWVDGDDACYDPAGKDCRCVCPMPANGTNPAYWETYADANGNEKSATDLWICDLKWTSSGEACGFSIRKPSNANLGGEHSCHTPFGKLSSSGSRTAIFWNDSPRDEADLSTAWVNSSTLKGMMPIASRMMARNSLTMRYSGGTMVFNLVKFAACSYNQDHPAEQCANKKTILECKKGRYTRRRRSQTGQLDCQGPNTCTSNSEYCCITPAYGGSNGYQPGVPNRRRRRCVNPATATNGCLPHHHWELENVEKSGDDCDVMETAIAAMRS